MEHLVSTQLGLREMTASGRGKPVPVPGRLPRAHELAAGALGGWLVLAIGLSDGGYFGRTTTAQTLVFAVIFCLGLVLLPRRRLTRPAVVTGLITCGLVGWTALSSVWAPAGADVWFETRRVLLYAVALLALLVVVDAPRVTALLAGLVAGISTLTLVALLQRAASGLPADPLYGALLEEPVGYPNALGVLMAMGAVVALGLAHHERAGRCVRARAGVGVAALMVFALGLTGSRGALLALVLGLVAMAPLARKPDRGALALTSTLTVTTGLLAWGAASELRAGGPLLAVLAGAALVVGSLVPRIAPRIPRRRLAPMLATGLVLLAVAVTTHPPSLSSSYRTAYWRAAVAETRDHPVLGAGAGSYWLSWREHRTVDTTVRDAHSLYLETLSELGPIGLTLVLALCAIPLGAGVRGRAYPLTGTATAAFLVFVVHAGIDWDWEMPVVTLAALGLAAVALCRGRGADPNFDPPA